MQTSSLRVTDQKFRSNF